MFGGHIQAGGIGLGLRVTRSLIEIRRGVISAVNNANKGSAITVMMSIIKE